MAEVGRNHTNTPLVRGHGSGVAPLLFYNAGEGSEAEPELGDRASVPIRIRR